MTAPLSNAEQREFFTLLQRVCENHVDNFLQIQTVVEPYTYFVDISLHPQAGDPDLYEPVGPDTILTAQGQGPPSSREEL